MTVRPTIYVTKLAPEAPLEMILYGIEEEEIPYEEVVTTKLSIIPAAYELAANSPLGVGIVVDQQQAVLHFKNLPPATPLFRVAVTEADQLMALGANAARLVKGIPFKTLKEVN